LERTSKDWAVGLVWPWAEVLRASAKLGFRSRSGEGFGRSTWYFAFH
jgi:hypothetical protein